MLRFLVAELVEIRRRRQVVDLATSLRQLFADVRTAIADGKISAVEVLTIAKDLIEFGAELVGLAKR